MFFPPVLLIRRNHILERLTRCGATCPERAVTLAQAGVVNPRGFRRFTQRLVAQGVLRETDGKYYLG